MENHPPEASEDKKLNIQKRFPLIPILIVLIALLVLSVIFSITFGAVSIPAEDVARIVWYRIIGANSPEAVEMLASNRAEIIWNIRMPRVLMAVVVGAGLALSGVVMQAVVKNPLANPYILGISSGASLGATAGILIGLFSMFGQYGVSVGAFLGALLTSLLVFSIAFSGAGRGNTIKLLLAGMAINAMCAAFTNFIIYTAKDTEGIRSVSFWTMGSLTSSSWTMLPIPSAILAVALAFFLTQFRKLNVMLLGEESAMTLGVNVTLYRKIYLVLSACVTGVVVAVSGTIGFVGLIVPHVVRMLVGSDHKRVTSISVLCGSIFLVWCDVFARTYLHNSELPIGIVTSMIGGPFFIYLMLTKNYGFGGD
ncbi:MAG: FecCD family ABC transporter permease [Aristaeellaceae bacterium]